MPDTSSNLALAFQSGPNKGKELSVVEGQEIIAGRGQEANIVIDDIKASRRHSKFNCKEGNLFVEDLGSVNGTFVNGLKVERALLFQGDKIEIANLRIKVVAALGIREDEHLKAGRKAVETVTLGNVLSTELAPGKLEDMLQFLASRQRTGALIVHTAWGTGRIYLRNGTSYHASLEGSTLGQVKILQRLLRSREGSMEFSDNEAVKVEREIAVPLAAILKESSDFPKVLAQLEKLLPSPSAKAMALASHSTLGGAEAEVAKLVTTDGSLPYILDRCSRTDTETLRILITLTERSCIKWSK